MSNTATTLGVDAINKSRQSAVEAQAMALVNKIMGNQKAIKANAGLIVEEQKKLSALALDVIDQKSIMETEWTPPFNVNQITILNGIKKLNDARQESVSVQSQGVINRIESYKATSKALAEEVTKWQKELNELSVDVVTVASVSAQQ